MSASGEYMHADHRLRSLLFGNGETTSGLVKGEDARLDVSARLFEMNEAVVELEAQLSARQAMLDRYASRLDAARMASNQERGPDA